MWTAAHRKPRRSGAGDPARKAERIKGLADVVRLLAAAFSVRGSTSGVAAREKGRQDRQGRALVTAFEAGRLKVARGLQGAGALKHELRAFKRCISPRGNPRHRLRVDCVAAIAGNAHRRPQRRSRGAVSHYLADLFTARRAIGLDGPFVFSADSKSGHIEEPRFALDAVEAATGIKVTVHDLRRTFITVAESCDIPLYALKGLVNHSMGNDVTAGYVVAGPERLRDPMQKVTDKFRGSIRLVDPRVAHYPSHTSKEKAPPERGELDPYLMSDCGDVVCGDKRL